MQPVAERLGVKTPGVPATPEALNSRYLEDVVVVVLVSALCVCMST